MTVTRRLTIGALTLASAGFVGGLTLARHPSASVPATTPAAPQAPAPLPAAARHAVPLPALGSLPDLSPVAEAALQVAANISSTNIVPRQSPWPFWFDDGPQYQRAQSLGSGVVVSADGLVLTNTHVVGGARAEVRVTLSDGRERPAEIIGIDDLSDLAVLKVEASGLQTLPWGDSSTLRVAEWVLAIGNPFQLSGTVTLGIVSTVSRSQGGAFTDFIQTDAAINPGNSGGALVNARGELVGINSMIYSETGGYQGIGFAIPSNSARLLMDELVANGSVQWGSIGIVEWVDPALARHVGLGEVDGPVVYRMAANSAAYRAGLRPGDILISFNGQPTTDSDTVSRVVARARAGTRVKVEIEREGRRQTLDLLVESRQQQQRRSR